MITALLLLTYGACFGLCTSVPSVFGDLLHLALDHTSPQSSTEEPLTASEPLWWGLGRLAGQLLVAYFCWNIYKIGFHPLNRVKGVNDVGWSSLRRSGVKKEDLANRVRDLRRSRKQGDMPPVYPNGWFAVAESDTVAKGQVESIQCLGETFAVFRGDDGVIRVLDAFCPHMGANMAVGGVVKGSCLECPFHGWLFNGKDGACAHIPYAKKVPEFTKVRVWSSEERFGFVFVWYDAEGRPPLWTLPSLPSVQGGHFRFRGRAEHHVLSHVQEIPENGCDMAHLGHLHVPNVMKGGDLVKAFTSNKLLDVLRHEWKLRWRSLEGPKDHVAEVALEHSFLLLGNKLKIFDLKMTAEQIGPAFVAIHIDTCLGKAILFQTVTPLEPLHQKLIHRFYSAPSLVAPLAKLIIFAEALQIERDIMIWNSKTFLSKPLLVTEDKSIAKFRRWYSRFYSKNSPRFSFRKENHEW